MNSCVLNKNNIRIVHKLLQFLALLAVIFVMGCKQNNDNPVESEVTITVEADEGYKFNGTNAPYTMKAKKGTKWAIIRAKVEQKIELKKEYEKIGWKLGSKDGESLVDSHVFNESATVVAISKERPKVPQISITVMADDGVNVASNNTFNVDKGSKWEDIKERAEEKVGAKENFEIKAWRLNEATGTLLEDETMFEENKTVFAVSERKIVSYQVKHLQQNIEDDEFTLQETEEKSGRAGENTEASAKQYEGFEAQPFSQALISVYDTTVVEIKYNRNVTSVIVDLKDGQTTTQLEDGSDGKKLLKGKFGAKVNIAKPTKDNFRFKGWEPSMPETFPAISSDTVYVATWKVKTSHEVYVTGDERVEVLAPQCVEVPLTENKTIADIKDSIKALAKLKAEWSDEDYEFYDWRMDGETGAEMQDGTQITGDITVYARTNYKRFKKSDKKLEGYEGEKPRGRIFLSKEIENIGDEAFLECVELTSVDLSLCTELTIIGNKAFRNCKNLKTVNLTALTKLIGIGESAFESCKNLEDINLSSSTELKRIGRYAFYGCEKFENIDLSSCTKLMEIENAVFTLCTNIKTLNLNGLTELTNIGRGAFFKCRNLLGLDLSSCNKLKKIGMRAFDSCLEAEIKLPISITEIEDYGFGTPDESTFCKKVLVPNEKIKVMVKDAYYPSNRIEIY